MSVGIVFPSEDLRNHLEVDVFSIEHDGYRLPRSGSLVGWSAPNPRFANTTEDLVQLSYEWLLNRLPVFARHQARGFQIDESVRSASWKMASVAGFLRENTVSTCVFGTASPHHIDTSIVAGACELVGTRQIYLPREVIGGRILPIENAPKFGPRQPLGFEVGAFDYEHKLERFRSDLEIGKPPSGTAKFANRLEVGLQPVTRAFLLDLRRSIKTRFLPSKHSEDSSFHQIDGRYPFSELDLALRHRDAMKYFMEQQFLSEEDVETALRDCSNLIVMAHFQPEATSFPEGGQIWEHSDLVRRIRSSGFNGRILYKEHPSTPLVWLGRTPTHVATTRSRSYYERLKSLDVEFIPSLMGLKPLMKSAKSKVVTMTGTVAIERALVGRRTVVTGNPWFKTMPGVGSLDEEELLDRNSDSGNLVDPNEVIRYLLETLNNKTIEPPVKKSKGECYCVSNKEFLEGYNALLLALDTRS